MAKKIKHEINKICGFCEAAQLMNNTEKALCPHKGVVAVDFCCKKFVYDPLKREPNPIAKPVLLDPDDLIL